MVESKNSLKRTIHTLPFFKGLPEDDIAFLYNAAVPKQISKNQVLFLQGEPATQVFVVISGWIKLSNINSEGSESGIQTRTRGDIIGIYPLFDGNIYTLSATSVTESLLLAIPAAVLKDRAKHNPDLLARGMAVMAHSLEDRQVAEACSAQKRTSRRIACLLLRLSAFMTSKGGTFKLPYEKSVAASQLGMDQATFSRALADLKEFGVMPVSGGEIQIDDFSRLAKHCCTHCPIMEQQCEGRRLKGVKKYREEDKRVKNF